MARRGDITANSTKAEGEEHSRKLVASIRATLDAAARKAAAGRAAAPPPITPRPCLAQFSSENIERLLRTIESAPTEDQVRKFADRVSTFYGRRAGVGIHTRRALKKCLAHYAKQYPRASADSLREVEGIRRFIRQQRSELAAELRDIRRKVRHLQLITSARAELRAIKEEFNKLGNDNQSTTP